MIVFSFHHADHHWRDYLKCDTSTQEVLIDGTKEDKHKAKEQKPKKEDEQKGREGHRRGKNAYEDKQDTEGERAATRGDPMMITNIPVLTGSTARAIKEEPCLFASSHSVITFHHSSSSSSSSSSTC